MMVFPNSIITEYNISGSSWVDISAYVVSDIAGRGGFHSSDPTEFTAGLGSSTFDLDNSGELFTVYGGDNIRGLNTLSGWNKGTKVRHKVRYHHYEEVVWLGFVQDIISDDGTWGDQRVHVTCLDWIDVASRYPMKRSQILTDKNLGQGIQSIVDRVSKTPEGIITGTYSTTFEAIFDNVRSKTKAMGEIDKLARSEMGRVYVMKDGYLMVEGETARKGTDTLTQVPFSPDNALMVSADNALMVSAGNILLIDGNMDAALTTDAEKLDLVMREEFWNDAFVKGYPTRTDTSLVVLFQIGSAIPIAPGQTIEFVGNYSDPNGGSPVNGTNMQTPAATTDYLMNTASDGSGSNITANLTVTADYYGDVVVYRMTSSYTSGIGYITKLQARGYGIYRNSSLESHISITGSASDYGEKTIDLNQTYQTVPYAGASYAASVLELYKTPKTRISEATYCANLNGDHMMAFLKLDIGDLIKVYDNRSGMYKWYYITSRKFVIFLGGIIIFSFGLCEHPSLANGGLNPVSVDFSGRATGDAINFGYLPHVSGDNVTSFTMSTWIYLRSVWTSFTTIMNIYSTGGSNFYFYLQGTSGDTKLTFFSQKFDASAGRWRVPVNALSTGTWSHIAVTYDINVLSDPVMYINGVSQTITEEQTPSGTFISGIGTSLVIGNTGAYANGVDAILKDVRFHDRILAPSEVLTLYNGGVGDTSLVTDGLVFQGLAINSDLGDASTFNGQQIPTDNKFFENILRRVGEPRGTPLIVNQ